MVRVAVTELTSSLPPRSCVQSAGFDRVQPGEDHHGEGHHRKLRKSRRGGDEEDQGSLRE